MAATKQAEIVALPMLDDPSCMPPPEVVRPTAEQITRLKALGDETRLTLVLTLMSAGDAVCACNLVPAAGVGQATVSHHLKVLREAGLVIVERRGIWAHYQIAPDAALWLRATLEHP